LILPLDWTPGSAELFAAHGYFPSPVEWGVAVGVLGYALLMFSLGLRFLPLLPSESGHAH
jgi:molybdopterin-containing oxidoreductase family membrane subunit